jgi:hypothetical protein
MQAIPAYMIVDNESHHSNPLRLLLGPSLTSPQMDSY